VILHFRGTIINAPFNHYLIPSQPVFNVRFHNGMLIATGEKTATAASVRTPRLLDPQDRSFLSERTHEYAHRHSRTSVTKGAVTRDVIRTYRCPHDNPNASELSIPEELRANRR